MMGGTARQALLPGRGRGLPMPFHLGEYFQKQGLRVVEGSLQRVLGKGPTYIHDEAHYRQTVIQPGWEGLPPPIRLMLRRRHDDWVALYLELRDIAFEIKGGTLALRSGAAELIASVLRRYFATEKGAPRPAAQAEFIPEEEPAAEPGAAAVEVAVGIDLGTTYS